MLHIKECDPILNTQTDSICAKIFILKEHSNTSISFIIAFI